jgi:hypothetical protein
MGAVATASSDTLRHWYYQSYLTYRTDSRYLGGGAAIVLNRWRPVFSAGARAYSVGYGEIYQDLESPSEGGSFIPSIEGSQQRYWDRRIKAYAGVAYPLSRTKSISARYSALHRTNLYALPDEAYLGFLPTRGLFSSIGGAWRMAKGESYTYSISPERARSVVVNAEWTGAGIGSHTLNDAGEAEAFNQVQVTAQWREYISVPWFANHVVALQAASGISVGDSLNYGSFRLGGSWGESGLYVLPDEYRSLRGFPVAAEYGDGYYLGVVEYRLPLWRVDRGYGTIPFFARTLHAAMFTDFGHAFEDWDDGASGADPLVGVGAELRLGMIVGWGLSFTGRLGYAWAVNGVDGYAFGDPDAAYFRLGTSF